MLKDTAMLLSASLLISRRTIWRATRESRSEAKCESRSLLKLVIMVWLWDNTKLGLWGPTECSGQTGLVKKFKPGLIDTVSSVVGIHVAVRMKRCCRLHQHASTHPSTSEFAAFKLTSGSVEKRDRHTVRAYTPTRVFALAAITGAELSFPAACTFNTFSRELRCDRKCLSSEICFACWIAKPAPQCLLGSSRETVQWIRGGRESGEKGERIPLIYRETDKSSFPSAESKQAALSGKRMTPLASHNTASIPVLRAGGVSPFLHFAHGSVHLNQMCLADALTPERADGFRGDARVREASPLVLPGFQ